LYFISFFSLMAFKIFFSILCACCFNDNMSWAGVAWWVYRAQARAGVAWQVGRDLVDWWMEVLWAVALWACRLEAQWGGGQLPGVIVAQ
jgi:hypothetical protein